RGAAGNLSAPGRLVHRARTTRQTARVPHPAVRIPVPKLRRETARSALGATFEQDECPAVKKVRPQKVKSSFRAGLARPYAFKSLSGRALPHSHVPIKRRGGCRRGKTLLRKKSSGLNRN